MTNGPVLSAVLRPIWYFSTSFEVIRTLVETGLKVILVTLLIGLFWWVYDDYLSPASVLQRVGVTNPISSALPE